MNNKNVSNFSDSFGSEFFKDHGFKQDKYLQAIKNYTNLDEKYIKPTAIAKYIGKYANQIDKEQFKEFLNCQNNIIKNDNSLSQSPTNIKRIVDKAEVANITNFLNDNGTDNHISISSTGSSKCIEVKSSISKSNNSNCIINSIHVDLKDEEGDKVKSNIFPSTETKQMKTEPYTYFKKEFSEQHPNLNAYELEKVN